MSSNKEINRLWNHLPSKEICPKGTALQQLGPEAAVQLIGKRAWFLKELYNMTW